MDSVPASMLLESAVLKFQQLKRMYEIELNL